MGTQYPEALALRNKLLCGLSAVEEQDAVKYEDIEDDMQRTFKALNPQAAVNMLAQFRGQGEVVDFVLISEEGLQHDPRFTMQGVLGEETFGRVVASSKVKCRQACSYLMWKSMLDEEIAKLERVCAKASTSLEERVAALSQLHYWRTVQKDASLMRGKKVLAAFVQEKKYRGSGGRSNNSSFKVVSLATGNRFIENGHLSCDGTVLIDCHAEVLARRGLLLYLYKEAAKAAEYPRENSSIFESFNQARTRLKKGVSFHLYVSTAPCGDSSLFTHSGKSKKPLGSEFQGQLRYKFERGEACRPTSKCLNPKTCLLAAQFGDVSITKMCCSDKICKWNVLGLQGALLSKFIDNIYLKSITIGDNFDEEHAKRAFSLRLGHDQPNKTPMVANLQKPFRIATPSVAHSNLQMIDSSIPATKHTSDHCMVWSAGTDKPQAFSASRGRSLDSDEPLVCKKALFEQYRHVHHLLHKTTLDASSTYSDNKLSATPYQDTKQALYERFQELGFGPWLSIYPEIDMFS